MGCRPPPSRLGNLGSDTGLGMYYPVLSLLILTISNTMTKETLGSKFFRFHAVFGEKIR